MFSVQRPGLNPTVSQLGFVVDKVALGQISLQALLLSTSQLCSYLTPTSEATVSRDLLLSHCHNH
jgi:hypothetical protein